MKKKKEHNSPHHCEYGVWSNAVYMLKKVGEYRPFLLTIMGLCAVSGSLISFLWSFFGKFVLDILETQKKTGSGDAVPLMVTLAWIAVIQLVCRGIFTVCDNKMWFWMIYVRMKIITERIGKTLSISYQMLEQPDILDMQEKAMQAASDNQIGVEGMLHRIYDFAVNALTLAVTVTTITVLDVRIVLVLGVLAFFQYLFFRYTVKKDKKNVWDKLAPTQRRISYMEQTTQSFDYAKDIRLFGMKSWLLGKQRSILKEKTDKMLYSRNLWIYNSIFAHLVLILSNAAVYAVLIYSVLGSDMSIGDFTMYVGLSSAFSSALTELLNSLGGFKECSLKIDDFRSFMDLKTEDETACLPVPKTDKYVFEFKNVSYKYKGQEDYALKNLNLTLEAGKRLAVVGLNGAGKTTFIKLLLRLYDATEGEILLNGTDIRKFKREEYYGLFSPVFQNVEIFAFSMAENVSMKSGDKTDKDLSRECLYKAGLKEKTESLASGTDTQLLKILYDDGIDLSGGEKQKLALARALYKNAPVMVLDEPTAALDPLAEYELYKSFDGIIGNKSAVYISHRLSSTRFCDSIAMFKAGEMVEYGTHRELLESGGAYAEMFRIQAQYYKKENTAMGEAAVNV
ncbi:MAG: ABC transporter ATP-binding protein/permease [Firmicutes bacterium]|nr:ABC transporter ATP-binding protein/permease [[Eubacterium] siraeum]MCM1487706.1 ABC transporter ATP-binding protein/permease [Bacillota bacterium]